MARFRSSVSYVGRLRKRESDFPEGITGRSAGDAEEGYICTSVQRHIGPHRHFHCRLLVVSFEWHCVSKIHLPDFERGSERQRADLEVTRRVA